MHRKELLDQMPMDKSDSAAARRIVELGYPAIAPVLRDMLLWLRVYDSPVADIFAKFFAEITPQPVELIAKHIGTRSGTLRSRILVDILPAWPRDAVKQLTSNLTMLATDADMWNNDLECFRLLLKYNLTEKEWVRQWLESRKEQAVDRVALIERLEIKAR